MTFITFFGSISLMTLKYLSFLSKLYVSLLNAENLFFLTSNIQWFIFESQWFLGLTERRSKEKQEKILIKSSLVSFLPFFLTYFTQNKVTFGTMVG